MNTQNIKYHQFKGLQYFRYKIAYSVLTLIPIEFIHINIDDLKEFQLSFINLICEITNGSTFTIDRIGSNIKFIPGIITNKNGEYFEFICDNERALSYYIEILFFISIFGKSMLYCKLIGITNNDIDITIDSFKVLIEFIFNKITNSQTSYVTILNRSVSIEKGSIILNIPLLNFIEPISWLEFGKISEVKGILLFNNYENYKEAIEYLKRPYKIFLKNIFFDVLKEKKSLLNSIAIYSKTDKNFIYLVEKCNFDGKLDIDDFDYINNKILENIYNVRKLF